MVHLRTDKPIVSVSRATSHANRNNPKKSTAGIHHSFAQSELKGEQVEQKTTTSSSSSSKSNRGMQMMDARQRTSISQWRPVCSLTGWLTGPASYDCYVNGQQQQQQRNSDRGATILMASAAEAGGTGRAAHAKCSYPSRLSAAQRMLARAMGGLLTTRPASASCPGTGGHLMSGGGSALRNQMIIDCDFQQRARADNSFHIHLSLLLTVGFFLELARLQRREEKRRVLRKK